MLTPLNFRRSQLFLTFASVLLISAVAAAAPCSLKSTNPSVTICTPENGLPAMSPLRVIAGTTDSSAITLMQIYADGSLIYEKKATSVDASLSLSKGLRSIQVKAKDASGRSFSQTVSVNIIGTSPTCALDATIPSVTICTPPNGGTMTSPLNVVADTTSSNTVTQMRIYVDGARVFSINRRRLATYVTLGSGAHQLKVEARDSTGATFSKTIAVTIGDLSKIKHIIFFLQENRSLDNYFGRLGQYRRDRGFNDPFDGIPLTKAISDKAGVLVRPYKFRTVCHENLLPPWNQSHEDVNAGKMDQFLKKAPPSTIDPDGTRAIGYYDWNELPYYYEMATQFATSDRFFGSLLGPTVPNRMYAFTGSSFGHIHSDPPPAGGFTQPTIFQRLREAGISWRYYYQDNSVFLAQFSNWEIDKSRVYNIASWYNDVQSENTLPSVIFIERASQLKLDEHPENNIQTGAASVQRILNALMQSPTWATSVFILTYDEGGGMYDHVVPQPMVKPDAIAPIFQTGDIKAGFNQAGFRIPLMVISPWVRRNYVSHTPRDLTSILRLIGKRFGISPLTYRDAAADDMTEFFDFSSPSWLTPPLLPTQPTTGACDYNLQNAPGH